VCFSQNAYVGLLACCILREGDVAFGLQTAADITGGDCQVTFRWLLGWERSTVAASTEAQQGSESQRWDAQAEYDVGLLIGRYLSEHPRPVASRVADRLEAVGRDLQDLGSDRLRALGLRHLRGL
jgi:hypothetical protein